MRIAFRAMLLLGVLSQISCGGGGESSATPTAPSGLSYASPQTYVVDTAISALSPAVTGSVNSYAVAPALPAGLALHATSGQITGTPTATAVSSAYVITATNAGGSTNFSLTIAVNPAAPRALNYPSPQMYSTGRAIAALNPTVTGMVAGYTVAPALPAGLSINPTSGQISGTPTAAAAQATYTVTAENAGGRTTFGLVITVSVPPVIAGFEAGVPGFDTVIAAGPDRLLLANNSGPVLRSKSGALLSSQGWGVFTSVLKPGEAVAGDPRVLYDEHSGRFFLSAIGRVPSSTCTPATCIAHYLLAVSKTSIPIGFTANDWHVYALDATLDGSTPTDNWPDFIQLGLDNSIVVLTARMLRFSGGFAYNKVRILDKSKLIAGQPVTWTDFVNVLSPDGFRMDSPSPALHFNGTGTFFLYSVYGPSCQAAVFVIRNALTSPTLEGAVISDPIRSCVGPLEPSPAQPNGGGALASGAGFHFTQVVFRNQSLWISRSRIIDGVDANPKFSLQRISVSVPSAPVVADEFLTGGDGGRVVSSAVAVDASNNVAVVLARYSETEFGSMHFTGRLATDPPGTLRSPQLLKAGTATLTVNPSSPHLWIDYIGAALDPANGTFWLIGSYVNGPNSFGSWASQISLP